MSTDLHGEADVSSYSYSQMYEATFKQFMEVFDNDGALFAEDYLDDDKYDSHKAWEAAVDTFNWSMLRRLAQMDLQDPSVQCFLRTAWDACTRFTGKTDAGLHGLCVGYAISRDVYRDEQPDWSALAVDVLDIERRRDERLKYEAVHPEALEERRLDEMQVTLKCDRATAERELQRIDVMIHEAMQIDSRLKH